MTGRWAYPNPDPWPTSGTIALAAGPGLAVACGGPPSGPTVATSPDGLRWTIQPASPTAGQFEVATDGTSIVACGAPPGGTIHSDLQVSADRGVTWATVAAPVKYVENVENPTGTRFWVAGRASIVNVDPPINGPGGLASSSDGTTWTTVAAFNGAYPICYAVSQAENIIGAVGVNDASTSSATLISYSTDGGTTWTQSSTYGTDSITSIAVLGTRFVVAGSGSSPFISYSVYGTYSPTTATIPAGVQSISGLVVVSDTLILSSFQIAGQWYLATSVDQGATWTVPASQPFPSAVDSLGLAAIGSRLLASQAAPNAGHSLAYTGSVPTRQYPRDDNLARGSVRQTVGTNPTSLQGSIRQGWRGTYS